MEIRDARKMEHKKQNLQRESYFERPVFHDHSEFTGKTGSEAVTATKQAPPAGLSLGGGTACRRRTCVMNRQGGYSGFRTAVPE